MGTTCDTSRTCGLLCFDFEVTRGLCFDFEVTRGPWFDFVCTDDA